MICDTWQCRFHDGQTCSFTIWSSKRKCFRTPKDVFKGICPYRSDDNFDIRGFEPDKDAADQIRQE